VMANETGEAKCPILKTHHMGELSPETRHTQNNIDPISGHPMVQSSDLEWWPITDRPESPGGHRGVSWAPFPLCLFGVFLSVL
jgi:hypothetical protein